MKLFAIIYYHKSDSMNHVDDYVVKAVLDETKKKEFFRSLNMFARDFYDYVEIELNDMTNLDHIMVK